MCRRSSRPSASPRSSTTRRTTACARSSRGPARRCYGARVTQPGPAIVQARQQFLAMVADVRPDLHRYCARLTGSVVDGEDIVQDALAKAFYALAQQHEPPPLRPWLFRIAHNQAMDWLKSHGRRLTEPRDDLEGVAGYEDRADPAVVRAALARFLALPVTQRCAVILK